MPRIHKAPLPTREIFDPFNSSSTGHQRAESRLAGSTGWRDSRSRKLRHQLGDTSGRGGSQHLSDLVGAGSLTWGTDGKKENGDYEKGAPGLREQGWQDIRGILSGSRKRSSEDVYEKDIAEKKRRLNDITSSGAFVTKAVAEIEPAPGNDLARTDTSPTKQSLQIFRGLTFYLNGSTGPEVSDFKLKQLFVQHGGNSSIALGRRTVTHVILGKLCGGGLASGKIHKEVTTIGGKGIKYVTSQWVLDSVKKGIRQPEGRYMPPEIATRIGGSRQTSVKSMFTVKATSDECG